MMLVAALRRYRNPFSGQDPWHLADSLYELFEELTLNNVALAADDDAFAARLAAAYRSGRLAALSREAQIVHRLWQAFLEDTQRRSPAACHLAGLRGAIAALTADAPACLIGFDQFAGGECSLLAPALRAGRLRLWLHGRRDGRDGAALTTLLHALDDPPVREDDGHDGTREARSSFLDAALAVPREPVRPSLDPTLRLTAADGPEHEARCVELAVREALLDGCRDVAVVTQDRRLARRLRALLERAAVTLHDEVGWALSTSAAAASLNAFLDGVDSGFQFRPLLDLLKSSFLDVAADDLQVLERDVVYGDGIEAGLERYRAALSAAAPLQAVLARVAQAARALPSSAQARQGQVWIAALQQALETLGLWAQWHSDAAGARLVDVLHDLRAALRKHPQRLEWSELRMLLDRSIERATFRPPPPAMPRQRVRLLTLEQSATLRCDAIILAGATRAQIPGTPAGEPFFNQSVRAELGLPHLPQRQALMLARLRRLLEAAPRLLITYAPDNPGEPAQLAPWIEALASSATAAGIDLRDTTLAQRAGTAAVEVAQTSSQPVAVRRRPQPSVPETLMPRDISASAHQSLIDCAYRFFAQYCLRLRGEQPPDEDPDRSDYGERVHRILHAFVAPVKDLPPPFGAAVSVANRDAAGRHFEQLADAVFAEDLRSRALAQIWLTEFRAAIPPLVDWLAARDVAAVSAEVKLQRPFGPSTSLYGRADRIEVAHDGARTVVDCKTGAVPHKADVEAGEAVQLLHYALLDEQVAAVEYLPLREPARALRIDEDLGELRDAVGARLGKLLTAIAGGAPLPAFGDDVACGYCDFRGLCRKGDWIDDIAPAASPPAAPA
jgi:ATP-dependent helicase/nuclease subunit B